MDQTLKKENTGSTLKTDLDQTLKKANTDYRFYPKSDLDQTLKKKNTGSTLKTDLELDQNPTLKNKTDPDPAI